MYSVSHEEEENNDHRMYDLQDPNGAPKMARLDDHSLETRTEVDSSKRGEWKQQQTHAVDPSVPSSSNRQESEDTEECSASSAGTCLVAASATATSVAESDEYSVEDQKLAPSSTTEVAIHPGQDVEMGVPPHEIPQPACAAREEDSFVPIDSKDPQGGILEQEKEHAPEEGTIDLTAALESSSADELVQATLIRDVDDTSDHSDEFGPHTLPTLHRDTTSAAIAVESDMAVVEAKPVEPAPAKTMSRKLICVVMGMLLLVIGALSVGFVVSANRHKETDESQNGNDNELGPNAISLPGPSRDSTTTPSPTATPTPVLQRLKEKGETLRCGVIPGPGLFYPNEGGEPYGFDASLCAAVAAAATGDPGNVEFIQTKFQNILQDLHNKKLDVVSAGITHTMERQVYQSDVKAGFTFTVPYLYQGMQLAGDPEVVDCGDRGLEYIAACANIQVCVVDQSTHQHMLSSYLPGQKLVPIENRDLLRRSLADGTCNVIAHEGYNLAESLVRAAGYEGAYKVGATLFSKEPLAMVTASDDPKWSDFVNSVVQSLVVAEAMNITQSTAHLFGQTYVFGDEYQDMLIHSISVAGNYGELYAKFLEPYSKRQGLNLINDGSSKTTGLLYSHPLGSINTEGGQPGETIKAVKSRGHLRCGVRANRPGFAELEVNDNGKVVVARGIEVDYCRALAGSIFEANGSLIDFTQVTSEQEGYAKLAVGDLDVFAGATLSFSNDVRVPGTNEGFSFTLPYFYGGTDADREENLCLVTKQGDHLWSSFVYWIAAAIVQAEETKITQGMSNSMPPIFLFGEMLDLMLQDAILTVGNYEEVYERNLERIIPRTGRNLLNSKSGAQMYPLPGMIGV